MFTKIVICHPNSPPCGTLESDLHVKNGSYNQAPESAYDSLRCVWVTQAVTPLAAFFFPVTLSVSVTRRTSVIGSTAIFVLSGSDCVMPLSHLQQSLYSEQQPVLIAHCTCLVCSRFHTNNHPHIDTRRCLGHIQHYLHSMTTYSMTLTSPPQHMATPDLWQKPGNNHQPANNQPTLSFSPSPLDLITTASPEVAPIHINPVFLHWVFFF